MSAVLQQRMTVEEFLAWSEGQEGRYELEDGFVVAVAPERVVDVRTKTAALLAFTQALRAAELPCTAYVDGLGLRVDHGALFIPDMLVCGEQPGDDEQVALRPIIDPPGVRIAVAAMLPPL